MYKNKKVLVTGATGFIGSHLTEYLVNQGADVTVMARMNSTCHVGWIEPLVKMGKVKVCYADIQDEQGVESAVSGHEIVYHLAAIISIPYSYLRPNETTRVNHVGTLNVLNAANKNRVNRVVMVSSSEVYGSAQYTPIDEAHPLQGQSPYSASKIAAEKACESYYKSFETPVVTVRPFNTYGPRQSVRAVIPTIIGQVLFSNELHLGALDTERDFTFVEDTVRGIALCGIAPNIAGEVINLGYGRTIKVGELCDKILHIAGSKLSVTVDPAKLRPEKSEVRCLLSNRMKAEKLLNWKPEIGFDEGLKQTIEWLRENPSYFEKRLLHFI